MDLKEKHILVYELIKAVDKICAENDIWYTLGYGSVLGAVRHQGFIPWDTDMDIHISISDCERFRQALSKALPEKMRLVEWNKEPHYHACFDRVIYRDIPHEEIHIDVFPLCGMPSGEKQQRRHMKKCYALYKLFHCKYQNIKYSHRNKRIAILVLKGLLFFVPDKLIVSIYKSLQNKYPYEDSDNVYSISSCYGERDYTKKSVLTKSIRTIFEDMELPIPEQYNEYLTSLYGDYMTPQKY